MTEIDTGTRARIEAAWAQRASGDVLALLLTELFSPSVIVLVLPLAVAWSATHEPWATLGWGLFVSLTSSVLPMSGIVAGSRLGWWDGHHVRNREGRLIPFALLIVLSSLGLGVLLRAGAPHLMVALDVAMLTALLAIALITVWWKVSVHTAVGAGAVAILAVVYSGWLLVLWLLVVAIGWSRVRLGDHSTAQVVVGGLMGIVAGGAGYLVAV